MFATLFAKLKLAGTLVKGYSTLVFTKALFLLPFVNRSSLTLYSNDLNLEKYGDLGG